MKNSITAILILTSLLTSAQDSNRFVVSKSISPIVEYNLSQNRELSLGVSHTKYYYDFLLPTHYHGPYLQIGTRFGSNQNLLINKVGYEYSFYSLIGCRINLINYTDFIHDEVCLSAEVGFSFLTFIYVSYGYSRNITKVDWFNSTGHLFSIKAGIPLWLDKKYSTTIKHQ